MVTSHNSDLASLEPAVKEDYILEWTDTLFTYFKMINKQTDQEFNTSNFLLENTIQPCNIFVNWKETVVTFTLVTKYEKESYRIKPGFKDIKIFHNKNEISSDFKIQPANSFIGYCNTLNNLDFYDFRQLKFEFHIKHMTSIFESIVPKKYDLYIRLKNIYKEKKFADLRIFVKNTEFLAHKAIVGRNSSFAEMFENSTEDNNVKIIDIQDMNPAVFEILLTYLYIGETEKIDFSKEKLSVLFDLIKATDKYKIEDLKTKLLEKTIMHLNKDNVVDILQFADRIHLDHLKARCLYYISVYRKQICGTTMFKNMIYKNHRITGELLYYVLQNPEGKFISF